MKNKILAVILGIGLVIVIGGAMVLYNYLGDKVETDNLGGEERTEESKDDKVEQPEDLVVNVPDEIIAENPNEPIEEVPEEPVEEKVEEDKSGYTKAYDFTVYDENGNSYKLSDFEGQPVVLNFWASWCGPCKNEMPEFEQAFQTYGKDIHFLMVNLTDGYRESVESAKGFIEKSEYTFPIYYDTEYDAAKAYSVYAIPATYFIDEDGYIITQGSGSLSAEKLQDGIEQIYSE